MDIETLQRRLRLLGWKTCELGLQDDGRWGLWVTGCGHMVYSMGNTRREAWSAACSTALKLTLNNAHPEPRPCLSPAPASSFGGGRFHPRGNNDETEVSRLIVEYERLRDRARCLFQEWDKIDRRMVEIERVLPDDYPYPGDPTEDCPLPR